MAVLEAQEAMLSTHNMLSPASGDPLVAPTLDMVMGCYYLTAVDAPEDRPDVKGAGRKFSDIAEARDAYDSGEIDLRAPIYVRRIRGGENRGGYYETTLGRLEFNAILPDKFVFNESLTEGVRIQNKLIDRGALNALTSNLYRLLSNDETAEVLDSIKNLGFQFATSSGITIAINDIQVSPQKALVMAETEERVDQYKTEYEEGLISEEERHAKIVDAWNQASFETADLVGNDLTNYGGIGIMALSGTKGNISQINQMAGMRGLVRRAGSTDVIELPVKSNFREGLTALEYFLSTHGARKGLTDTALNTASSGYLTRRLIDVAQEVIIQGEGLRHAGRLGATAPGAAQQHQPAVPGQRPAGCGHPGPPRDRGNPGEPERGHHAGKGRPTGECRDNRDPGALPPYLRGDPRGVPHVLRRPGCDGPAGPGRPGRGNHSGPEHRRARHAAYHARVPHRRRPAPE